MLIFTAAEKRAILITILVILSACAYQILNAYKENPYTFNYEKEDSLFARLSTLDSDRADEQIQALSFHTLATEHLQQDQLYRIDLNTAGSDDLQKLPRVGPAMAARILEYRQIHGRFKSIDELMQVKGIGKKTFEKIKPYLVQIR